MAWPCPGTYAPEESVKRLSRSAAGKLLVWGALIIAWGSLSAQAPAVPGVVGPSDRDLHVLIAVQGEVTVKRKGWITSAPAGFGTILRRGDLVRLAAAAQATVACADLSIHDLAAGRLSGVPCPGVRPAILVYERSLINPTRSEASDDIPIVISPRRTKLLSLRPVLRWAPMPGVTRFKVAVRGPGVDWTLEVNGATSTQYAPDAPALVPGATYKVSVTAGGHSSDELSEPGLGFTLLSMDAAQEVRVEAERIRGLGLASEGAQLLTAHLYASRGLKAESIEQFETLAKSRPVSRVLQELGILYQAVGINRSAEEHYLQAAKSSRDAGYVEGQALALQALGLLYREAFGLPNDATRAYREALALFEKLGDERAVQEVKERLAYDQSP